MKRENLTGEPELSLRELYYHGVFERKLFTVEDVLIDLSNRKIDADLCARSGEIDAAGYERILSEIREAKAYFEAGVSAAWFEDEGFEKDEEGRVTKIDGEEVRPLPVEKIRESMQAFLKLMRKSGSTEDTEIPLEKVYEAGVFRYGDFTVEEAAVDVHNRLTDAYLLLDTETDGPDEERCRAARALVSELKEAKAWADGELVKVHFLMADAKKDAHGRITSCGGRPVLPIDDGKLKREYEEYLRMAARRRSLETAAASGEKLG